MSADEWVVPDPSEWERPVSTGGAPGMLISNDGSVVVELIEPVGGFGPTVVVTLPNGSRVLVRESVNGTANPKHTVVHVMAPDNIVVASAPTGGGQRGTAYPHPKVMGNNKAIVLETRLGPKDED